MRELLPLVTLMLLRCWQKIRWETKSDTQTQSKSPTAHILNRSSSRSSSLLIEFPYRKKLFPSKSNYRQRNLILSKCLSASTARRWFCENKTECEADSTASPSWWRWCDLIENILTKVFRSMILPHNSVSVCARSGYCVYFWRALSHSEHKLRLSCRRELFQLLFLEIPDKQDFSVDEREVTCFWKVFR